jgi:hypothetical protein
MKLKRRLFLLVGGATLIAGVTIPAVSQAAPPEPDLAPVHATPIRGRTTEGLPDQAQSKAVGRPGGSNGISYRGGPVMTSGQNAYVIWYGDWASGTRPAKKTIIKDFLSSLGGSDYYKINTGYYDGGGNRVTGAITWGGEYTDTYSRGGANGSYTLSDSDIQTIVGSAITTNKLPADSNGVYFVLTSVDVKKSGFLTSYCGWHTYATLANTNTKYSFVGDPGSNGACSVQTSVSPNGDVGADAMVSVIAHEIEESATDPNLNAWYDNRGYENADKCAWTFGTTYSTANGSLANMSLGGNNFLVQRNWVNASGGYCSLS